ncbi:MAG TPA: nitrate/nitrite transporter NrtS [Myxococcota bacterium]|jgi:hypothetical protein|nr:nitrate/nitrite transporter NrtS [Myxococcota bacterium]
MKADDDSFLALALRRDVVRRALRIALVVGCVLVTINHGDRLVAGAVTPTSVLQMGLTVVVPYVVSTVSSVGALREAARQRLRD